jgi:hypothetical protein
MPIFVPGLQLSKDFYREAVRPILDAHFPGLVYSTALIGSGSEVIGFDTERSTDHMWGPRLILFVAPADRDRHGAAIVDTLGRHLPYTFRGYSTHFGTPDTEGIQSLEEVESGPVQHRVEVTTLPAFCAGYLGHDLQSEITVADWLTFSEHKLLTLTAGRVFHDGLGTLEPMRRTLAYYPHDVWLYLLASQWQKISQEEAFVGRCGDVGDEIGSRLIAARIVQYLMELCFLMERRYLPYSKWFGSAFARLAGAPRLAPFLEEVLRADAWQEREASLARAYAVVAEMHNALGITRPLPTEVTPYFNRPYLVIHGDAFAAEIAQTIQDERIRAIGGLIGSVNQFVECVDIISDAAWRPRLQRMFAP